MRLLVEHQVGAAQDTKRNRADAEHFGQGIDQGIVAGDLHRTAINFLAIAVKSAARAARW